MGTNGGRMTVTVEVDTSQGTAAIRGLNEEFRRTGRGIGAEAERASRGIDGMSQSMFQGAFKAQLLWDSMKQGLEVLKALVQQTVLYAARTETLSIVNAQLIKTNGLSARAVGEQVAGLKRLGITTQEAYSTVNQMIFANLDLAKSQDLARLAQDAAVIAGKNSSETLQGILHGIVSQQTDVLRTYGIQVDFEHAFAEATRKKGEALTVTEKKQVAYDEVLKASAKINGAYEASLGSASKQLSSLTRYVDEAKNAVGDRLIPVMSRVVKGLTDAAIHVEKHADFYANLAKMVLVASAALGTFKVVGLLGITGPIGAVAAALAALVATFVVLTSKESEQEDSILRHIEGLKKQRAQLLDTAKTSKELTEGLELLTQKTVKAEVELARLAVLRERKGGDGPLPEWISALSEGYQKASAVASGVTGVVGGAIGTLVNGVPVPKAPGYKPGDSESIADHKAGLPGVDAKLQNDRLIAEEKAAAAKAQSAERGKQIGDQRLQAQRQAQDAALSARGSGLEGPAKLYQEMQTELAKARTAEITAGGKKSVVDVGLTTATVEARHAEFLAKLQALQKDSATKMWASEVEASEGIRKIHQDLYVEQLALAAALDDRQAESDKRQNEATLERYAADRDAQMREAERLMPVTIQQKVALEGRKAAIEADYLRKTSEMKLKLFDVEAAAEETALRRKMSMLFFTNAEIEGRVTELRIQKAADRAQLEQAQAAAVVTARESAEIRSAQMIYDHNQKVFDGLKRQAEGLFDQLFTKGKNFFESLADVFKLAMLTAIKAIVTSQIAKALMGLTGTSTAGVNTGSGGGLAGAGGSGGGWLGAVLGIAGGGGVALGSPSGGTPPFLPAGTSGGGLLGGGGGSALAGGGLMGNLKAQGAGLLGSLKGLGNLGGGGGRDILGNKLGSLPGGAGTNATGVQGAGGGAMLLGGAMLAMDGLRRGGWKGMAETTAGGALIGAKFGGPVGAAIGAGVGAVAGLVRMMFKGAVEKVKKKVREIYGIDIDTERANALAQMAKDTYGGNIEMAVRSQQGRELINLYAMSTDQGGKVGLDPKTVRSATLAQTGSGLYQVPSFESGRAVGLSSSLPSLGSFSVAPGAPTSISVRLDGEATTRVLSGVAAQAITDNTDVVMDSVETASRGSYSRRSLTASQISPSTLLR